MQKYGNLGNQPSGCLYLLLVGQGWVDKLAVENTGALGVRGQEPDHKGDLQLKVKRKPVQLNPTQRMWFETLVTVSSL